MRGFKNFYELLSIILYKQKEIQYMRVNNVPNQYHHARAIDNYYINQNSVPRKLAHHDSNARSPARSPN